MRQRRHSRVAQAAARSSAEVEREGYADVGGGTFVTITYDGQHRVTSLTQVTDNATMKGSTTR
ncbi:hypothetical protein ACWDXH_31990, partial [Micromonospora chokoriensis]